MTTISDLSCYNNGRRIYGTAAILHRMFAKEETPDHETELKEYKALIQKLGYAYFDDEWTSL